MTSPSRASAGEGNNAAVDDSKATTTVAVVRIVDPPPSKPHPLNVLGASTRRHVLRQLRSSINDPSIKSIILIGGNDKAFSAGADITEFDSDSTFDALGGRTGGSLDDDDYIPTLTEVTNRVEDSPKPVIAAIHGVALGGGSELALSSHYRIADRATAIFGLPEVNIGLIPGAGGTQRLPRLSGVKFALDVITTGRNVTASEAKTAGIIDGFREDGESLLDCAKRWAKWAELLPVDNRRTSRRSVPGGTVQELSKLCDDVAKRLPKKERGGQSVHACVDAVRASFSSSTFEEGLDVEREIFLDLLLNSDQGRGRRHAFFAVRSADADKRPSMDAEGAETLRRLTRGGKGGAAVGVVGAGTMGSGIAVSFLRAGYDPVILVDNNAAGLERGVKSIQKILKGDVVKGKLDEKNAKSMSDALRPSSDMSSLKDCLLVVEAVFENLKVKRSIFKTLNDVVTNPHALLLSNTSTLDVDAIASALPASRRPNCAGMHFFSPAHVMELVEIVKSSSTSPSVLSTIRTVTKNIGKIGVTVGNCHGFVGNRMLAPYTAEMVFVLEEGGSTVEGIDGALTEFGMAIGPFVMADLAGNDIGYLIRKEQGITNDPNTGEPGPNRKAGMRYTDLGDELVTKLGRVGQKALKGWYDYDPNVGKGRRPIPSEEVSKFVASRSRVDSPAPSHNMTNGEIVERLLSPLVNEAFKILEEGIAPKPSDVDVIYLHGYGWPAWRGGPVFWADREVGLPKVLSRLEELHRQYPGSDYFRPSELLRKCVSMGITVEEYYKRGMHRRSASTADESISKL